MLSVIFRMLLIVLMLFMCAYSYAVVVEFTGAFKNLDFNNIFKHKTFSQQRRCYQTKRDQGNERNRFMNEYTMQQ